jgi:hypothetical protein
MGRVTVVKSLILAKLNYIGQMLPNPPEHIMKDINNVIYTFIWNGKPDKVKRTQIIQDYELGGVKVPHVESHLNALKVSWLKRVEMGDQKWVKLFHFITDLTKNDLFQFGKTRFHYIKPNIKNDFWHDVLQAWALVTSNYNCDPNLDYNCIARNYLWWNDKIKIGNKSVHYRHWMNKGIYFVNDLLNEDGKFMSFDQFQRVYDLKTNLLEFQGMINCIRNNWKYLGR